jgi:gas vesicle protein
MKTSRVVLGVMAGAAVGTLVGVLFAPDKGSATRSKITKKGEDFVNVVKGRANHLKDQMGGMVDRFAEKLHSTTETKLGAENSRARYTPTAER